MFFTVIDGLIKISIYAALVSRIVCLAGKVRGGGARPVSQLALSVYENRFESFPTAVLHRWFKDDLFRDHQERHDCI